MKISVKRKSSTSPNSVPSEVWIDNNRKEVEKLARVELEEEKSKSKTKDQDIFEEESVDKDRLL